MTNTTYSYVGKTFAKPLVPLVTPFGFGSWSAAPTPHTSCNSGTWAVVSDAQCHQTGTR